MAGSPTGRLRRFRSGVAILIGIAVLFGVLLPLTLAAVSGSLAIPHNDAWSYSRIAQVFARTGRIRLLGWNRSALIGQFVVLGPLARWLTAQQVFVAIAAVAALLATYDLLLGSIGRRRAAFAALVITGWPGFGLLATTFMLDVPTMAAMMICLALGRRALERRSSRLLITSVVVGLWGVTIREQGMAAPVSVLLVAGLVSWRTQRRFRPAVLVGTAIGFLAAVVAFEAWRQSIKIGANPPAISIPVNGAPMIIGAVVRGYFLLALFLAPAVFLVARPWRWRLGSGLAAVVAFAVAVDAVLHYRASHFFVGNYMTLLRPYWVAGHGRPVPIFPLYVWWLAVAVACVSGVLLAGILVRRLPNLSLLLGVFLLAMVAGNVGVAITGQTIFDRYWLPLMPPLLAAILSERGSLQEGARTRLTAWSLTATATAGVLVLSLSLTAAGMAYDNARWRAARELVTAGIPAVDVDPGLEWKGYHSAIGMSPPGSWHFPGSKPCFTISATSPLSGSAAKAIRKPARPTISVVRYRTFLVAGTSLLWVRDNRLRKCEGMPAAIPLPAPGQR